MKRPDTPAGISRGFTITELLVVIGVLVLLVGIAVPSLRSLIASNERTLAEGQFRAGLGVARDAAIRSERGDAAAVFLVRDGRIVIIPALEIGTIDDDVVGTDGTIGGVERRSVFVPSDIFEPITMPRGWSVRGFAPPLTTGEATGWYESLETLAGSGNWVYPETEFFDPEQATEGWKRQSFYVRFAAGTGIARLGDAAPALLIDAVDVDLGEGFRASAPFNALGWNPNATEAEEGGAPAALQARRLLARSGRGVAAADVRAVLGDLSPDTILLRPVVELALYNERDLASGIGARDLNPATSTLYGDPDSPRTLPLSPTMDLTQFPDGRPDADVRRDISAWIEGRFRPAASAAASPVASTARVFTVQRYRGQVEEVQP
jgi:prepilin-type N-terminal cleavage/methylation domain-containing protein